MVEQIGMTPRQQNDSPMPPQTAPAPREAKEAAIALRHAAEKVARATDAYFSVGKEYLSARVFAATLLDTADWVEQDRYALPEALDAPDEAQEV